MSKKTQKQVKIMSKQEKNPERTGVLSVLRAVSSRLGMAARLGRQYSGSRNVYTALGYPTDITFEDYFGKFTRQDIAKRIVNAPANATWRGSPVIIDDKTPGVETEFEKKWASLASSLKVFHYMARADRVSGIGRFGVLFLGFNDGAKLASPVGRPAKGLDLVYLAPYSEDNASVHEWETNIKSPRFGLPKTYKLKYSIESFKINSGETDSGLTSNLSKEILVHYSRVIHIAEGLLENDTFGTPRLEAVYNRLMNLELLSGGSAEMFWRGAFPGMGFMADADADFDPQDKTALNDEIDAYVHGLKRYFKMQGVTAQQFEVQFADPSSHFDLQIKLISAATGIPARILIGSERGELSSSQDERAWLATVSERRNDFAEPIILRELIDRLIIFGILPAPKNDVYEVLWPDIYSPSEADQAAINKRKAEALAIYANAPNAWRIMSPRMFMQKIMGFSPEEIMDVPDELPPLSSGSDPGGPDADLERDGNKPMTEED